MSNVLRETSIGQILHQYNWPSKGKAGSFQHKRVYHSKTLKEHDDKGMGLKQRKSIFRNKNVDKLEEIQCD